MDTLLISSGGLVSLKREDTGITKGNEVVYIYKVYLRNELIYSTEKRLNAEDIYWKTVRDVEYKELRVRCPICKKWRWEKTHITIEKDSPEFNHQDVPCLECLKERKGNSEED